MSLELVLDGENRGQFASGLGYQDLRGAAHSGPYATLQAFFEAGETDSVPAAISDLKALASLPDSGEIGYTAAGLADMLTGAKTALVFDGVVNADEDDTPEEFVECDFADAPAEKLAKADDDNDPDFDDPAVLDDWLTDPEFKDLFDEGLKAEKLAKGGEGYESVPRDAKGRWEEGGGGGKAKVDPKRAEAARRAWDTIRANRAAKETGAAKGKPSDGKPTSPANWNKMSVKQQAAYLNALLRGERPVQPSGINRQEIKPGSDRAAQPTAAPKQTPQQDTRGLKFKTADQVTKYAKSIGVKLKDESGDMQTLNRVASGLAYERSQGSKLPPEVRVYKMTGVEIGNRAYVQVPYGRAADRDHAVLHVNSANSYWHETPKEHAFTWGDNRLSSLAENHIMSHEIGHYQNALNVGFDKFVRSGGVRFTPAQRTTVAKEVSTYGSTSPREMVAEVFAGHRDGKTYSDKIEGMYSTMFHKGKL